MNRNLRQWVGVVAVAGLISPWATPAEGAQNRTTGQSAPATSAGTPAKGKRSPSYSAKRARARRAALARARTRAAIRAAELAQPRYKLDGNGDVVPDLQAAAAIIYEPETNHVIWEVNSQTQRSIASITKVMTATVFLENDPDLAQSVAVIRADVARASTTFLRAGDRLTTGDLLHLLLIASDNAAARVLARVSPYGADGFVQRMNEHAVELGLTQTSYVDPSGLLAANLSSAYDMARLITHASQDERIASIMRLPEHTVFTERHRAISVRSTNYLLGRPGVDVRAAKTGFISRAGYCLATLLRLPDGGPPFAVVVLGAQTNAGRFLETRHLLTWLSSKAMTMLGAADRPQIP